MTLDKAMRNEIWWSALMISPIHHLYIRWTSGWNDQNWGQKSANTTRCTTLPNPVFPFHNPSFKWCVANLSTKPSHMWKPSRARWAECVKSCKCFYIYGRLYIWCEPNRSQTLNNQSNMCAYKPIAAWEAGRCSFCQVLGFFLIKYVQMLFGT